jgi:hypothetical protein
VSIEVVDVTGGEVLAAGPMTLRIIEDGSHTEHRLGIVDLLEQHSSPAAC